MKSNQTYQQVVVFSLLPLFKKNRPVRSPCWKFVCLCISAVNSWAAEAIYKKLGMCIWVPKPISAGYFINPSNRSFCLYVYLSLRCNGSVKRYRCNGSVKRYRGNKYPRSKIRIIGGVSYAVCVVWKESKQKFLYYLIQYWRVEGNEGEAFRIGRGFGRIFIRE
jgi:hypothetical protein